MSRQHRGYICENGRLIGNLQRVSAPLEMGQGNELQLFSRLLLSYPTTVGNAVVVLQTFDNHWHVVIVRHDVGEVVAELDLQKFGISAKQD